MSEKRNLSRKSLRYNWLHNWRKVRHALRKEILQRTGRRPDLTPTGTERSQGANRPPPFERAHGCR